VRWRLSHRADSQALPLADRHYSRQKPGTPQFVKPGSCVVLLADSALWVTSAPIADYVKHEWAGAWECSMFRNEGKACASELIKEAVAVTRHWYGEPPALGMVTFVDPRKVPGFFVRTKEGRELRWGYSYWRAGFKFCGWTKGGLYALQLLPVEMPEAAPARGGQAGLFDAEEAA
jgi:hypothetical protein